MLYIDASRYSNRVQRTGVENYSYFLIQALAEAHPKEITLITPKKVDLKVAQIVIPFPRLWTHLRLSWEIFKNKKIKNLFVPSHVLPLFYAKKSSLTIHDVAFKTSPESYGLWSRFYLNWSARFAVKHAYKIIAPSQKTKADLIHFYHCPQEKIEVIPLGFTPPTATTAKSKANEFLKAHSLLQKQFFLYLGRIETKKNSDTLLKAFFKFAEKNQNIKLVLAGFPGHGGQEILKQIPSGLKQRIVLPGYVSEAEKQVLLQEAACFIFPSREEGFGIPLLEAMNVALPIIASDIPTSREIGQDKIHFFPPENPSALTELMVQVLQESKNPSSSTKNPYSTLLKKYSWQASAETVYQLLNL